VGGVRGCSHLGLYASPRRIKRHRPDPIPALLLARLWDPVDGTVRLDGRDLRDLAPGAVPSEVAYVPQEAFLSVLSLDGK
jgi:hypothetical protein